MLPLDEHNRSITPSPGGPDAKAEIRALTIPANLPQAALQTPPLTTPRQIRANSLAIPVPTSQELKKEESRIKHFIDLAALNPNEKNLTPLVSVIVEEIIQEGLKKSKVADASSKNRNVLDLSVESESPITIEDGYIKNPGVEIGIIGVNIVSRTSSIVGLKILLNKISEAISAKKEYLEQTKDTKEIAVLEKEIEILTTWLNVHKERFSGMLKDTVIETTFSLPKAASAIITLAQSAVSIAAEVIDWIGVGIGLVGSALCFHLRHKDFDEHELWANILKAEDKTCDVYQRQKTIFEERLISNLPELEKLLATINSDLEKVRGNSGVTDSEKEEAVSEAMAKLEEAGIELPEKMPTLEALQAAISNPADKNALNIMMVKKKEMLSVSLKNGLKTLDEKKNEIDREFLINAEGKAFFFLVYSIVMTVVTIVLKALIYTGVFVAGGTVLSVLGYGGVALLVGALALGGIYLYKTKPNTFKTYITGVQARLAFWKIPLAIQDFRRKYALLENIKISEEIKGIWHRIHTIERLLKSGSNIEGLESYREELEKAALSKMEELKSLDAKVEGLNRSIDSLEEKVKPLQAQVDEAGGKDFSLQVNGKAGKTELISHDENEIELTDLSKPHSKGLFHDLAEFLKKDPTIAEDPQIQKILAHRGVDLSDLSEGDLELLTAEVAKRLRATYAMETQDTLNLISRQKRMEEYGL